MVDKDGSAPLCRLAPRCSPLREAIVDLRACAVRAAAGRPARCRGPWGDKLAPAAHIFDVCVVYTVCTPAPVPSVPTREARLPVFAPCPDWLGGGSRLACNRSAPRAGARARRPILRQLSHPHCTYTRHTVSARHGDRVRLTDTVRPRTESNCHGATPRSDDCAVYLYTAHMATHGHARVPFHGLRPHQQAPNDPAYTLKSTIGST